MAVKATTARAKKLDAVTRKIALYAVQETYSDEGEAQGHLANAIGEIEKAQALIEASDAAGASKA